MAITTYAELKTAIANWLHRSDLTSYLDDFVTLAEARMNYGSGVNVGDPLYTPPLRLRQMEAKTTVTISAQYNQVLPSGFLEPRSLVLTTSAGRKAPLSFLSPVQMDTEYSGAETGQPKAYAIVGNYIRVGKTPDASYSAELIYYAKLGPLSSSLNDTFTAAPNLYLFSSLIEAGIFLSHGKTQDWAAAFRSAAISMQNQDRAARWAGGPLTMRTNTGNP